MQQDSVDAIKAHPRYQELVKSRKRFAWILTIAILAIYYGFILTIAFAPQILGTPLWAGATTTIGIPIGVVIIISAFILTGIYVARANGRYDALTKEIREEMQ